MRTPACRRPTTCSAHRTARRPPLRSPPGNTSATEHRRHANRAVIPQPPALHLCIRQCHCHPSSCRTPIRYLCFTPSPSQGEGWGEGPALRAVVIRIDSSTESISSSTSLFQYLITLNPSEVSHAVLAESDGSCSWWCPPSISMTRLRSRQTKSTMYFPIGDCRLNLRPINLRLRSLDHRSRSASVDCFLSSLCSGYLSHYPHPNPLPGRERGKW